MKPRCVIKQLYPQQQGVQAKASELFRQEAQQLLTAGQYPSIPTFLDYFEQEDFQYLVQEYIEGQNLAEILKTGQIFKESEVKALLETMLETVDFLHHHKIIHRDIKPANIIRSPNGRFILVDLGAAKLATGTALGQTGTVIGSAEYVAPEQLRGKAIFASDLYSLGATCVTLLTGMSPFSLFDTSTGAWEWRDYLVQNPVSASFGKILDRLLMGPTKLRYESADEVLGDLEGRSNVVQSLPSSTEKSLQSQNFQVTTFSSLETSFLPHQMLIRRTEQSNTRTKGWLLVNPVQGLIIAVALIISFPSLTLIFVLIVLITFFVWFSSLFLALLVNSGDINGSEIHLMKSNLHQTAFILNSKGGKKDRKILTKNITCVEVTRKLNNTSFDINIFISQNIWIDQIHYKFIELEEAESMELANSIADWLDVPLYCRFPKD